jgi:hypothetical protein
MMNGPNSDFDISRVRVKRGYTVQKKNYILPTIYPRKQIIRDSTVFYIHTVYSLKVLLLSYSVNQCIIIHGKLPITLNVNINWKNTYHWTDNSNFFPRMEWQSIFETKRIYSMNVKYRSLCKMTILILNISLFLFFKIIRRSTKILACRT